MTSLVHALNTSPRAAARRMLAVVALAAIGACAQAPVTTTASPTAASAGTDPRVGLKPGMWDAGEAISNLRLVSTTRPPERFLGGINSDLAFKGNYVIQGSFRGYQVWDISNPLRPTLKTAYLCPASQSDASVYKHLLFVSAEAPSARLDCGTQGVPEPVSADQSSEIARMQRMLAALTLGGDPR